MSYTSRSLLCVAVKAMKRLGISAEGPIPKSAVQELLSDGEVVEFLCPKTISTQVYVD